MADRILTPPYARLFEGSPWLSGLDAGVFRDQNQDVFWAGPVVDFGGQVFDVRSPHVTPLVVGSDWTAAINATIQAAAAVGGGAVYVPDGLSYEAGDIVPASGVVVRYGPLGDLFLAGGGVINFNAGDITITGAPNQLMFAGGISGYFFDNAVQPTNDNLVALGATTQHWSDLFLGDGAVINFSAGNFLLTHSSGLLTASGGIAAMGNVEFYGAVTAIGAVGIDVNPGSDIDADLITVGVTGAPKLFWDESEDAFGITNGLRPSADDGAALGASGTAWSDLFLAGGGVINFDAGDMTITGAPSQLMFAGGTSGYFFDNAVKPTNDNLIALGATTQRWSDLFLGDGAVINFNAGDVTLTHVAGRVELVGNVEFYGAVTAIGAVGIDVNPGSDIDADLITVGVTGAPKLFWDESEDAFGITKGLQPSANDDAALGASGTAWSDLFLGEGAVINFAAGDITITGAPQQLMFAGGTSGYFFDNAVQPTNNNLIALGTGAQNWSDLFLGDGAVINFSENNFLLTHSSGLLTASGGISTGGLLRIGGALEHEGLTAGFYGTVPVAKQTGVAVDAAGIHAALVALGLFTA